MHVCMVTWDAHYRVLEITDTMNYVTFAVDSLYKTWRSKGAEFSPRAVFPMFEEVHTYIHFWNPTRLSDIACKIVLCATDEYWQLPQSFQPNAKYTVPKHVKLAVLDTSYRFEMLDHYKIHTSLALGVKPCIDHLFFSKYCTSSRYSYFCTLNPGY